VRHLALTNSRTIAHRVSLMTKPEFDQDFWEQLDLSHSGHAQQRPEVVIGELQRDLSPLGD
jgi:hypothetical protein